MANNNITMTEYNRTIGRKRSVSLKEYNRNMSKNSVPLKEIDRIMKSVCHCTPDSTLKAYANKVEVENMR